ncbi:rhodanese-like domain-containing protein [Acetobacter papayae]|uniref:hypothetical protein n=1 Tax=Acetobacter papayae TaxID=1076592 RepID=UPI001F1EABF3|nr:hypothetical protein [Acetobacter papayae]
MAVTKARHLKDRQHGKKAGSRLRWIILWCEHPKQENGYRLAMSLLVQADELATLLRSPTPPVVFDATALLPGEGGNPAERFLHEHIAGSLYFDIDIFSDLQGLFPHTVPSAARYASLMGALGVARTDPVVFYDQATPPRPAGHGGWPRCSAMTPCASLMAACRMAQGWPAGFRQTHPTAPCHPLSCPHTVQPHSRAGRYVHDRGDWRAAHSGCTERSAFLRYSPRAPARRPLRAYAGCALPAL